MIVYANREQRVRTRSLLNEVRKATDCTERLIRYGQFEAGVLDEICPKVDDSTPLTEALRTAAMRCNYDVLERFRLPEEISIRDPEGYAFYAVYPDMYRRATVRFYFDQRPARCVVIGIRSIGTSLSTVVAAVLEEHGCATSSFTVRPHGHPFDRQLHLSHLLEAELALQSDQGSYFLVVDEGPGLSGTSFTSVAEKLNECGVPDDRIIFLPAHQPDYASFNSPRARQRWPRHRVYVEPFQPNRYVRAEAEDFSGGLWRNALYSQDREYPPVQPWHERRKYRHGKEFWKFSGLGHYGRSRLERAEALKGYIPSCLGLHNGFLISEFVMGRPLRARDICSDLIDSIAAYLAHLRRTFQTRQQVPYAKLIEMIQVNTGIEIEPRNPLIESGTAVAGDGRMLPHEWLYCSGRFVKTDALDHHDDHFFPGCQDIAWDIAGASVEFCMNPRQQEQLIARYLRYVPDATLRARLPFYRQAYLAYRIAYSAMAEQQLAGTPDGLRFRKLNDGYRLALDPTHLPVSCSA